MGQYWVGPYNVRVPNDILCVVAKDGYNTTYKSGGTTEMFMMHAPPMDRNIYREKFTKLKDDGYYYYTGPKKQYWIGPYDVRVPNDKPWVVADDGYNIMDKDGEMTGRFMMHAPLMNQTIYREKYAELKDDGYYYYK